MYFAVFADDVKIRAVYLHAITTTTTINTTDCVKNVAKTTIAHVNYLR
jgi:hypothetical protein